MDPATRGGVLRRKCRPSGVTTVSVPSRSIRANTEARSATSFRPAAKVGAIRGLTLEHTPGFTVTDVSLSVSNLAAQAGISADAVRYYERIGVLPTAPRTPNGYRVYAQEALDRLRFIKGAQSLGLRLDDIRALLEVRDRGACPCGHTETLLRERMADIDAEVRRLRGLRAELGRILAEHPESTCPEPTGTWWCEREFMKRR